MVFEDLVEIVVNKIMPLLQEYFYEDWEKIESILGGSGNYGNNNFFLNRIKMEPRKIFKNYKNYDDNIRYRYSVVSEPTRRAFINVYSDPIEEE